jgi:hypothetical protein
VLGSWSVRTRCCRGPRKRGVGCVRENTPMRRRTRAEPLVSKFAKLAEAQGDAVAERCRVEGGGSGGPASNGPRTLCYHFATQLGSTARYRKTSTGWYLSKPLEKTRRCRTGRHELKQRRANFECGAYNHFSTCVPITCRRSRYRPRVASRSQPSPRSQRTCLSPLLGLGPWSSS